MRHISVLLAAALPLALLSCSVISRSAQSPAPQPVPDSDTVIMETYIGVPILPRKPQTPEPESAQVLRPRYLQAGDTVAVCAGSNAIDPRDIMPAVDTLQSWGLNVVFAPNLLQTSGRYAGDDSARSRGLQEMMDAPGVRALLMARGGYGLMRVLDSLDLTRMREDPRWIVGYSDVTALHSLLAREGIQSLHGPMAKQMDKDPESLALLRAELFGEAPRVIRLEPSSRDVPGIAEGRLVGGNLSLLYALLGTGYRLDTRGCVLFIEDVGEPSYSVDRMLAAMSLSGSLDSLAGVIVGEFTDSEQGIDLPVDEVILSWLRPLGVPVIYGYPAGHDTENRPLRLGAQVRICAGGDEPYIRYLD